MSKPSWDDAPKWANWLTMDSSGEWSWFAEPPILSHGEWFPRDDTLVEYSGITFIPLHCEQKP